MESEKKIELIQLAIQQLIQEEEEQKTDSKLDQNLLSRLLAQLETFKGENEVEQPELSSDPTEVAFPVISKLEGEVGSAEDEDVDGGGTELGRDEIVKELREVKRQNFITHCLLSAVIVLTVVWQLSEVSLILKVKNRLSNPFGSVGSMLTGFLNPPGKKGQNGEKQSSSKGQHAEGASQNLKIPEFPQIDLPGLGIDADDD